MIRDITIGQYYPTDSVIHRLDPRTKLVWTLAYIFSLFLFRSFASYAVATILLITVIKISKVPFKFMVKGMKAVVILLLITVVFNLFLIPGTTADLEAAHYLRRIKYRSFHGITSDLSDHWFVCDDTDHYAESAYRWNGKGACTAQ